MRSAFHTQISCFIFSPTGAEGYPRVRDISAALALLPSHPGVQKPRRSVGQERRAVAEQQLNIQISLFKQPETLQNHA